MKTQTYFNTKTEQQANVCDLTKPLCVNCAGTVNLSNINNSFHRNDYYLLYIIKGKMDLTINGKNHIFKKDEFIIISPDTPRSYKSAPDEVVNYYWIHFTGYEAEELLKNIKISVNTIYNIEIHSGILNEWNKLFHEFIINDEHFQLSSSAILKHILVQLSRYTNIEKNKNKFKKSIEYIYENYSVDISIKELSAMEGLSETHYRTLFKSLFGISPCQYIIDRRVESAMVYLKETEKKLSEIASIVGYDDVYYFGRIFKKKTGISPGHYRRQSKNNAPKIEEIY